MYGALLPPWLAGLALSLGAAASAFPCFWLGRLLWRDAVRALSGRHLNRLSRELARAEPLSIAMLRQASRSSFGVVNLVAGASHVRFRAFILGTWIGIMPGALLLTLWAQLAWRVASWPGGALLLLAVGALALLGARRLLGRVRDRGQAARSARLQPSQTALVLTNSRMPNEPSSRP